MKLVAIGVTSDNYEAVKVALEAAGFELASLAEERAPRSWVGHVVSEWISATPKDEL